MADSGAGADGAPREAAGLARSVAGDHPPAQGASMAYESPEAVQVDDTLSTGQKRRFLEEWLATLDTHLESDEVADTDAGAEATLADRIRSCLEELPAD